jgi:hypothetical protein
MKKLKMGEISEKNLKNIGEYYNYLWEKSKGI